MSETPEQCLYPACEFAPANRGLYRKHYQAARLLVKSGKVTWKQLEELGKVSPRKWRSGGGWFMGGVK